MTRIAFAIAASLVLAAPSLACAAPKGAAARGKPRAPVTVEATLAAGSGTVTVRFDRAATAVQVHVKGLDGLTVTSDPEPVKAERVVAGEVAAFDVTFTPGRGRSLLSVAVSGDFGGARRAAVVSFPVGEKSAEQRKRVGTVIEGPGGERVKVLPAGE
jgi:hypothetical protein